MKNIKRNITNARTKVDAHTTVNKAGGGAYTISDRENLIQFAMTGTLGNSFYATQEETVEEAQNLLERTTAADIAEAIVKGRNEGFVRSFNIIGLVYLSKKDTALFSETFQKVIRTGNDLIDFIELCKTQRGLGRSIKRAISNWINSKCNVYYAQKYKKNIADAIRISRHKSEDPIVSYVMSVYKDKVKKFTQSGIEKAFETYPILKQRELFIEHLENGDADKAFAIIEKWDLEVDSLTSVYDKFNLAIWKRIAALTPVMKFLKFLNKFDTVGLFKSKDGVELARTKLTTEALTAAKVFPFRLWIASKNVTNDTIREHLYDVLDDYTQKFDWGVFNKNTWAILPDVSGSMTSSVSGSTVTPATVAGMFCGFFLKGIKDCICIPWDTRVNPYNHPKKDTVATHIKRIEGSNGGGTNLACGVDYLLSSKTKVDCCVFITDTECYSGGWAQSWARYKVFNPKAKAFIIRVCPTSSNPISDSDAKRLNVYQIFGWNDNVINYIKMILEKTNK